MKPLLNEQKHPWLSIIGIGEDGLDGLSPAARRLIAQAVFVVGGERHLSLIGDYDGESMVWPSPIETAFPHILARRGEPVVVLGSGDPFFYGIGSILAAHLVPEEMSCLPSPSAFSLVAARLGWAQQECALLSLHGRPFERIIPRLQPNAKIIVLSWDGSTPMRLARLLIDRGLGSSRFVVCEALGGVREKITDMTASDFSTKGSREILALNSVAIDVVADDRASIVSLASGLPDSMFEHDNQITKREIRAMTLSALAPRQGEVLWDIGAGSGSVGIEWMLRHPENRAFAIEPRPERAARITRNAVSLGVPDIEVLEGAAPEMLVGLPVPDAIFIGGGGTDAGVFEAAWSALKPGGRLVMNAVTLETQADLIKYHTKCGGELISVQIARAVPVGPYHGWRAAMPVTQWSITKPLEPLS